jgi:hypothetical protein
MPVSNTKIAKFKPRMKQINGGKLVFIVTIEPAEKEENQYFKYELKKCHYL